MSAALVARGLTKTYGGVAAVDGLDLSVEPGTLYGFLGPNGAGKTTTIRIMLGLIHASAGEVEVLGEPVTPGKGVAALRRVGALVEEPAFWRYLSGRKNLEYFARAAGPADDRRARLGRLDEALDVVGVLARGKLVAEGPPSNLRPAGDRLRIAVDDHVRARKVLADLDGVTLDPEPSEPAVAAAPWGSSTVAAPALGTAPLRLTLTRPASAAAVNATLVAAGLAVSELTPEHERLEDVFLDLVGDDHVPR